MRIILDDSERTSDLSKKDTASKPSELEPSPILLCHTVSLEILGLMR